MSLSTTNSILSRLQILAKTTTDKSRVLFWSTLESESNHFFKVCISGVFSDKFTSKCDLVRKERVSGGSHYNN